MKEKFTDTAVPGGRPSATGWNERTQVLERLANAAVPGGLGAFFSSAFEAVRAHAPFGLVIVRMADDLVPAVKVDSPLSGPTPPALSDAGGDPEAEDVFVQDDADGPEPLGAVASTPPPDSESGLVDLDLDPPDFAPGAPSTQPAGTYAQQTGFNAIVQSWDQQKQDWSDTDEGLVVYGACQVPCRSGDVLPAYWDTSMGQWVLLSADQVQTGVTVVWPGDAYPNEADSPNVYAVTFVTAAFVRDPGAQTIDVTDLPDGPHAIVCNLASGSYIPEGTLVWCFRSAGHWFTYYAPGGAGGSDPLFGAAGASHAPGDVPDPGATAHAPPWALCDDRAFHQLLAAKGDLLVTDGASLARLPAPATNGWVLTYDSSQTYGVKWAAAPSGGGGPLNQGVVLGQSGQITNYSGSSNPLPLGGGGLALQAGDYLVLAVGFNTASPGTVSATFAGNAMTLLASLQSSDSFSDILLVFGYRAAAAVTGGPAISTSGGFSFMNIAWTAARVYNTTGTFVQEAHANGTGTPAAAAYPSPGSDPGVLVAFALARLGSTPGANPWSTPLVTIGAAQTAQGGGADVYLTCGGEAYAGGLLAGGAGTTGAVNLSWWVEIIVFVK